MEKSTHTPEYAALRSELCSSRKSAGLSQRDLAARLKVPHSWVAKVESGERRIDLVEFCWFVSACGIDPHAVTERLLQRIWPGQFANRPKGGRSNFHLTRPNPSQNCSCRQPSGGPPITRRTL